MKCEMDKVMKHISFLLNEATKPGVVFDLEGTLLYVNNSFRKEFGVEETGNMKQLIVDKTSELWDKIISCVNESETKTFDMNIRVANDKIRVVKVQLMYFEDVHQIIALFDVPHNHDGIAKSTYNHAFRNSDRFLAVVDQDGIIYDVNEMHTAFFNVPREYFIGKEANVFLEIFQEDTESFTNYMNDVKLYGYAETTKRFQKSLDDARYYHITTIFDSEAKVYFVRMDDRTEKMILEERLEHSGSLSTVGELAASIAHEIRNPMTTLKGFVQLLKLSVSDDALKYLSVIDDEIVRMELILSEMLILSKPGMNKKTIFSLEVLVADMLQVMHPKALMEGITILQKQCTLQNTLMNGDADKIKQVLLNLFKNAFEAMSTGGTLTTSMELNDSGNLILNISDTGKGMTVNQINQVFIPFYTCKPEGTGLGLPFVLKTIEEHGGTISVESEVGKGTTFIVTFPLTIAHNSGTVPDDKKVLLSQ